LIFTIDFAANIIKLRPLLWKNSFYSYLNNGWYIWNGADHLYENEIHSKQTNGFKTRGLKPNKKINKNIILLGDSFLETSHKITEMPEKYLRDVITDSNVISFGSWGWGNDQQLLHLEKYIKDIKPEKVVLFFQLNDLKENITKHGFLGSKPTFGLKKKDNLDLKRPYLIMEKNYFEYSYFYRAINKVINKMKLKNQKTVFDMANECNKKISDYDNLETELKKLFDKKYYSREIDIANSAQKPYNKTNKPIIETFDQWQKKKIKDFLKYNKKKSLANNIHSFNDALYYTSEIMTPIKKKGELITNKLINEIQKVAIENNSDFYVINIFQNKFHRPLSSEKQFVFCKDGKELVYSNKAYDDKIKRIFKNINYILNINLEEEFGYKTYDFFDGHLNNGANKFVMERVAEFINK
jgi:hypothetical protein